MEARIVRRGAGNHGGGVSVRFWGNVVLVAMVNVKDVLLWFMVVVVVMWW